MNILNSVLLFIFSIFNYQSKKLDGNSRLFCVTEHSMSASNNETNHLPVLLWHGMGDTYDSESMKWVVEQLKRGQPDLNIYSIYIDTDSDKDREASVFGNVMVQLTDVCDQVKNLDVDIEKGFNGIGFSQGGLFIRSLAQTCNVTFHNIISVGSPQNGIADLPPCDPSNWMCKKRNEYIKGKMYTKFMQENNIQAQYYRDIDNYDTYLLKSSYLKFVNNELFKDLDYFNRLISLNKFVMIMFEKDETLVPKESAWFWDIEAKTGIVLPFEETDSYKYDMIGLQTLNKEGKIDFLSINDVHLKMSDEDIIYLAKQYL